MKEPELKPSDIPTGPQAASSVDNNNEPLNSNQQDVPTGPQAASSVDTNPVPWDSSQHNEFPEEGREEDGESLPSFEAQGTGGVDPLNVPGCAQIATGNGTPQQQGRLSDEEYPGLPSSAGTEEDRSVGKKSKRKKKMPPLKRR
eukprot:11794007-Karenia_brevis.AAC.1